MSVKTDPASAEIPSAEVFVPAAILDPDFPGLRAAPGQPAIPGQPDPSGSSVPCAQSVPCDQSVPGDISVASGQPVTPGLPAVPVRPVSPAQGAIAGRPAVPGYGAICTDGAGPSGALPSVAGVPPSFGAFALAVYPFLELQPFHRAYYRVLEAFAAGRIRRLIVTMPPQHGKSVGATTLLPAYVLGLDPDLRVAIASYSGALASKFNRRVQRIVESREYAALFPATTIKQGAKPPGYIRTDDELEDAGAVMEQIEAGTGPEQGLKERAAAAADCSPSGAKARSRVTASTASSSTTSTRMPSKPIRPSSAPTVGSGIPRSCGRACTTPRAN